MIKVYYCFKPFEDTSQVCYHTVDLLIFFYTHRKDRNLLFMTETYHIPFIGHYILIRSYCFHFGSSVSSPVLLLPIQFLCLIGIVWMNPFVGRVKKQRTGNNMVRCRTVTTENYIFNSRQPGQCLYIRVMWLQCHRIREKEQIINLSFHNT